MSLADWLVQIRNFPELRDAVGRLQRHGIEPKRVRELDDRRQPIEGSADTSSVIEIWFSSLRGDFTVIEGQGTLEATFQPLELGAEEQTVYAQTYGGDWDELAQAIIALYLGR